MGFDFFSLSLLLVLTRDLTNKFDLFLNCFEFVFFCIFVETNESEIFFLDKLFD